MILFKLSDDAKEDADIPVIKSDLVTENEGFKWKGHQPLVVKADKFKMPQGFQPTSILTISPPASVNSLAFSDDYGILAIGTAHGLIILDTIQSTVALTKCTLNAQGKCCQPTVWKFSNFPTTLFLREINFARFLEGQKLPFDHFSSSGI